MSDKKKVEQYDQLMLRYKGLIVKVCQIYCRQDSERARDLYQDIALNVWTHMESFNQQSSAATWLWRLAVNTAIDNLRAIQRRPVLVTSNELPERAEDETPGCIDDLYDALTQLPADDQMLMSLRLDGFDYRQIAQQMDQSEGALRTRYSRIVKQLREMLKGK